MTALPQRTIWQKTTWFKEKYKPGGLNNGNEI